MKVPFLDLSPQLDPIEPELQEALGRLLSHKQFILGKEVEEFEEALATYLHVPYAIGVASGSDAILLALMALDLDPDAEVITTPFTFFSTASALVRLGIKAVFADVESQGYQIDPEAIRKKITPRTRALLPVHLYGHVAPIAPLKAIAEEFQLSMVEDVAQAFGARIQNDREWCYAGTLGEFGCFSFFPTKNLGGFGDGGAVVTSDPQQARKLKALRHHGSYQRYHHELLGINSRLDALQAAFLGVRLRYIDSWNEERRKIARRYREVAKESWNWDFEEGIPNVQTPVIFPPAPISEVEFVYHQFVVRAHRRDHLKSHLEEQGIGAEIYYPSLVPFQPCMSHLGAKPGDFPYAERLCQEVLALPIYPGLSPESIVYVIKKIKEFYR
ncbi:MAG: DegT/DnrJ/EryC1/StrS family aminotransferase [Deltaproteobacteria bacterium]|nr:DegT/DnrJ/EryC1/StrS family aminotransferase [Deltaproteobacteria bacterium]